MSSPPLPPPSSSQPPPQQQPIIINKPTSSSSSSSSSLPDIFLTAISIFFLFSKSPTSTTIQFPKIPFFHSFQSNPHHRRFLKFPTMSISHTKTPPTPTPTPSLQFPSPQSLSDWLSPRLPSDSFSTWGIKPGTKNIHNLWLELFAGETTVTDSVPPIRTVNVVTVRIISKCGDRFLVESHQELSDGSVRKRFRPLSEKIKPNESPEQAVVRAVKEELGCCYQVRIVPGSCRIKVEERNSVSYPGLPARYLLNSVDAEVDGLPEGDFCTEEKEEYENSSNFGDALEKAVSVRKHYWTWVCSL
ncbi:hypothetical protein ACFE04_009513 [Oxalis oulophora]